MLAIFSFVHSLSFAHHVMSFEARKISHLDYTLNYFNRLTLQNGKKNESGIRVDGNSARIYSPLKIHVLTSDY